VLQLADRLTQLVEQALVLQRPDAVSAGRGRQQHVEDAPVHPARHQLPQRRLYRAGDLLGDERGRGHHERDHQGTPLRGSDTGRDRARHPAQHRAGADDEHDREHTEQQVDRDKSGDQAAARAGHQAGDTPPGGEQLSHPGRHHAAQVALVRFTIATPVDVGTLRGVAPR
jgi:hypothetical protein